MGIASKLLERVACHAQGAGVERLTALCLASNRTVIRLLARLEPTTIRPARRRGGGAADRPDERKADAPLAA